jgi:hypothetical protein
LEFVRAKSDRKKARCISLGLEDGLIHDDNQPIIA